MFALLDFFKVCLFPTRVTQSAPLRRQAALSERKPTTHLCMTPIPMPIRARVVKSQSHIWRQTDRQTDRRAGSQPDRPISQSQHSRASPPSTTRVVVRFGTASGRPSPRFVSLLVCEFVGLLVCEFVSLLVCEFVSFAGPNFFPLEGCESRPPLMHTNAGLRFCPGPPSQLPRFYSAICSV